MRGGESGIIQWQEWRCQGGGWYSPLSGRGAGVGGIAHSLAGVEGAEEVGIKTGRGRGCSQAIK